MNTNKNQSAQDAGNRGGASALTRSTGSMLSVICDFFEKHNADEKEWDALDCMRELRAQVIEECAMTVETQDRGSCYQWESESHFDRMTKEMANQVRSLQSNKAITGSARNKES